MLQDPPRWTPRLTPVPETFRVHVSRIQTLSQHHLISLMSHLIVASQHQPGAAAHMAMRRLDVRVPAHLVSPVERVAALLVELEPLLAAAVGHAAVQRHVAVVCLRGLVDGQLGLFRSSGGGGGEGWENLKRMWQACRQTRRVRTQSIQYW